MVKINQKFVKSSELTNSLVGKGLYISQGQENLVYKPTVVRKAISQSRDGGCPAVRAALQQNVGTREDMTVWMTAAGSLGDWRAEVHQSVGRQLCSSRLSEVRINWRSFTVSLDPSLISILGLVPTASSERWW